jgi:CubicO group peptidase (beta-lactamase class C family)
MATWIERVQKPTLVLLLMAGMLRVPVNAADAQEKPKAPKTFDLAAIDAFVTSEVKEKGYAGLSLAILREGEIVLAKGYGKRLVEERAAVEAETPFAVGSVTKQFTCACILLLAEDGKLSVDDPVAKFEPTLKGADEITLYDLMTHLSGYPDFYPLDFVDRRLRKPIEPQALLAAYAKDKLDFPPGERWSYSNTGYTLLGDIVAKASGKPFGQFLKERILEPVGMSHSAFEPGPEMKNLTRGYTSFALGPLEPAEPEAGGWLYAAGGLWASAPDLARWSLALVDGHVLKTSSYRLMTTPRPLKSGHTTGYGCGLNIRLVGGETVFAHGGAVSGFLSTIAIVPRKRSAVILLTNTEHISADALHTTILGLLLAELGKNGDRSVPKVSGPPAREAALAFFHELQTGNIKREHLGEEFSIFLTEDRVKGAADRFKPLGEPAKVEVRSVSERGGMEVCFVHKTVELGGLLYRSPDGKIQQFLIRKQ